MNVPAFARLSLWGNRPKRGHGLARISSRRCRDSRTESPSVPAGDRSWRVSRYSVGTLFHAAYRRAGKPGSISTLRQNYRKGERRDSTAGSGRLGRTPTHSGRPLESLGTKAVGKGIEELRIICQRLKDWKIDPLPPPLGNALAEGLLPVLLGLKIWRFLKCRFQALYKKGDLLGGPQDPLLRRPVIDSDTWATYRASASNLSAC